MATRQRNQTVRPSGRSVDEYPGYEKWTFKRWAWEFLRRNPEFQRDCRNVGADIDEQRRVAAKFDLKEFVSFKTSKRRSDWAPKFLPASVSTWSWLQGRDAVRRLPLSAGDVIVRFRISAVAKDKAAIDAQLEEAARILRKRLKAYREQSAGGVATDAGASKPTYFLRSLRLLDLLDGQSKADKEPGRALRLLHQKPNSRSPMSDAEALEQHRKQIDQARQMMQSGYLGLISRDGVPRPKAFVSADISHPLLTRKKQAGT